MDQIFIQDVWTDIMRYCPMETLGLVSITTKAARQSTWSAAPVVSLPASLSTPYKSLFQYIGPVLEELTINSSSEFPAIIRRIVNDCHALVSFRVDPKLLMTFHSMYDAFACIFSRVETLNIESPGDENPREYLTAMFCDIVERCTKPVRIKHLLLSFGPHVDSRRPNELLDRFKASVARLTSLESAVVNMLIEFEADIISVFSNCRCLRSLHFRVKSLTRNFFINFQRLQPAPRPWEETALETLKDLPLVLNIIFEQAPFSTRGRKPNSWWAPAILYVSVQGSSPSAILKHLYALGLSIPLHIDLLVLWLCRLRQDHFRELVDLIAEGASPLLPTKEELINSRLFAELIYQELVSSAPDLVRYAATTLKLKSSQRFAAHLGYLLPTRFCGYRSASIVSTFDDLGLISHTAVKSINLEHLPEQTDDHGFDLIVANLNDGDIRHILCRRYHSRSILAILIKQRNFRLARMFSEKLKAPSMLALHRPEEFLESVQYLWEIDDVELIVSATMTAYPEFFSDPAFLGCLLWQSIAHPRLFNLYDFLQAKFGSLLEAVEPSLFGQSCHIILKMPTPKEQVPCAIRFFRKYFALVQAQAMASATEHRALDFVLVFIIKLLHEVGLNPSESSTKDDALFIFESCFKPVALAASRRGTFTLAKFLSLSLTIQYQEHSIDKCVLDTCLSLDFAEENHHKRQAFIYELARLLAQEPRMERLKEVFGMLFARIPVSILCEPFDGGLSVFERCLRNPVSQWFGCELAARIFELVRIGARTHRSIDQLRVAAPPCIGWGEDPPTTGWPGPFNWTPPPYCRPNQAKSVLEFDQQAVEFYFEALALMDSQSTE